MFSYFQNLFNSSLWILESTCQAPGTIFFFFFFEMALILDEFGENVIFFKTSFMSFIKTLAFSL